MDVRIRIYSGSFRTLERGRNMFSILIETTTSVYRLNFLPGEFEFEKVALKPGCSSRIAVGEKVKGRELMIDSRGCLQLGGWSLSPLAGEQQPPITITPEDLKTKT